MTNTLSETFEDAFLQVDRAKELLNEINILIKEDTKIGNTGSFRAKSESNVSLKLSLNELPLPRKLLILSKDILNNLISPLDHIAVKIFTRKDKGKIYFPIRKDEVGLKEELNKFYSDIPGIKEFIIDEIKAHKDGNYPLWAMRQLNNTVKHKQFFSIKSKTKAVMLPTITAPGLFIGGNIIINTPDKDIPMDNRDFISLEGIEGLQVHDDGFVNKAIFIKEDYPFGGSLLSSALAEGIEAVYQAVTSLQNTKSVSTILQTQ